MIRTTDKYALVYLIAINSSAHAVAGLLTYATATSVTSTKTEGIHATIQAAASS